MLKVGDKVRVLPSIVENDYPESFIGRVGVVIAEDATGDPLAEAFDDQLVSVGFTTGEALHGTFHHRFEKVEES